MLIRFSTRQINPKFLGYICIYIHTHTICSLVNKSQFSVSLEQWRDPSNPPAQKVPRRGTLSYEHICSAGTASAGGGAMFAAPKVGSSLW